jgi:hypothetical protein
MDDLEGQTMDDGEYFALRSPRLGGGFYDGYMTVPEESVYRAIDALRIRVAEWDAFDGDEPVDEASRAHVAAAADALARLMRALADHEREGGVGELVRQIADFLSRGQTRAYLDGLRDRLLRNTEELRRSLQVMQQLGHSHTPSAQQVERHIEEIADDLVIVEALTALHQQAEQRETERTQQYLADRGQRTALEQPPAAQQAPATERDGWDF